MKFLLFSTLFLSGCSLRSYTRQGDRPFCLVDYKNREINCLYKSLNECQQQYSANSLAICFKSDHIKRGY